MFILDRYTSWRSHAPKFNDAKTACNYGQFTANMSGISTARLFPVVLMNLADSKNIRSIDHNRRDYI